jgi:dienelactone hydrolase
MGIEVIAESNEGRTWYMPPSWSPDAERKYPAVLGLPGLAAQHDKSRIDVHARQLAEAGFIVLGMTYSDVLEIEFQQTTHIRSEFHLHRYVSEANNSLELLARQVQVDENRVGVVASSISASVTAYLISPKHDEEHVPIRALASIAPFVAWKQYLTDQARLHILTACERNPNEYLTIGTSDRLGKAVQHSIKLSSLYDIMRINVPEWMKPAFNQAPPEVLTIGGTRDSISIEAFRSFHSSMRGGEDRFVQIEDGHNPNPKAYSQKLQEFFVQSLQRQEAIR